MKMTGNTLLITGGGSGIGRALAQAFHARGNQVIIAGRRESMLEAVTAANPGMRYALLDIENADAIRSFAAKIKADHPALNAVIHNAGIMRPEVIESGALDDAEATIATNLLGPIRLNAALLPLLRSQAHAAIMTVSSGLAFVPRADHPTYCATKAAIHSYTESLRSQLEATAVQVLELVPPYVQTDLTGERQAHDPMEMPLQAFIDEVMHILTTSPGSVEICVERVKMLRYAEKNGTYDALFARFNAGAAAH